MPPKNKRSRSTREKEEIASAKSYFAELEAKKKAKANAAKASTAAATAPKTPAKRKVKAKLPKASATKGTKKKSAPPAAVAAAAKKKEIGSDDDKAAGLASSSDEEPPSPEKQPPKKRRKTAATKTDDSDLETKKPAKRRAPKPPPGAIPERQDDDTDAIMEIAQEQPAVVRPSRRIPKPPPGMVAGSGTVAAPVAAPAPRRRASPRRPVEESGNSTPPPRSMMLKEKPPFGSPPPRRNIDPPVRSSTKPAPMMPNASRKKDATRAVAAVVAPVHQPTVDDDTTGVIPVEEPEEETMDVVGWSTSTKVIVFVSLLVAAIAIFISSVSPDPTTFLSELVDSGPCFEDAGWDQVSSPSLLDGETPARCIGVSARSPCPGICSNGKLVSCGKYAQIQRDACVLTSESLKATRSLKDLVRLATAKCAYQTTCQHSCFAKFEDDRPLFYFDKLVDRPSLKDVDAGILKAANQYHSEMFLIHTDVDGTVSVGVHPSMPLPQSFGTTLKRTVLSFIFNIITALLGFIRFVVMKLVNTWLACFRSSPWITTLVTFVAWIIHMRWQGIRENAQLEAKVVRYRLRALKEIYESEGRETTSGAVFARIAWEEFPTRERDRNHLADTIWVHVEKDIAKDPRVRKEMSRENGKTITHWQWADSRGPHADD